MNEPQAATSVRHSVVVDVPIDQAFNVFTEDFGRFKPPEHNLLGVEIAETVFEARVGGSLYDRGIDGSECRWARVLVYEPPHRVVISWDIGPSWQIETDPGNASEVEVRFVAETSVRTRSSWSTATWTATVRDGRASGKVLTAPGVGRCT